MEGDHELERQQPDDKMYLGDEESGGDTDMQGDAGLSEEDTKILLEKEFDDYYEDRAHKSAGAVIKTLDTWSLTMFNSNHPK